MSETIDFERTIISRGALRIEQFEAHTGVMGNCKLELDEKFLKSDRRFAGQLAARMASQLEPYSPKVIIPVPKGANYFGGLVADELEIEHLLLNGEFRNSPRYENPEKDKRRVEEIGAVALIDDVKRTGTALREVAFLPAIEGNVVVAGVIWDRSDTILPPDHLGFNVEAIVKRFIPLQVDPDTYKIR